MMKHLLSISLVASYNNIPTTYDEFGNDNAFKEFFKAAHDGVNVIITTYNTASKCLGDLIEEIFYEIATTCITF